MSKRKLWALMVGINHYAGPVTNLSGCVNDVDNFKHYLEDTYKDSIDLCIETLTDSEATRKNIIRLFRGHLKKARKDDVVLFYFSGHGSRQPSVPEFKEFFPEGLDETLVCYDSRLPGKQDLADKELAVLLAKVAANHPHIAVVLDCCHSGSGTRTADDFNLPVSKYYKNKKTPNQLDQYINGYYKKKGPIIPGSRHILMAACQRTQKAWEGTDQKGVFTSTLLEVLEKSGNKISYADLFFKSRSAIRKRAYNQTPQFEFHGGFNAYIGFLDGHLIDTPPRYMVYFEDEKWKIDIGALHGLPTEPSQQTRLALYREGSAPSPNKKPAGYAKTVAVNAQVSSLELEFKPGKTRSYRAEIFRLPISPMTVYLEGEPDMKKLVKDRPTHSFNVVFTNEPKAARYKLNAGKEQILLEYKDTGKLIQEVEVKGYTESEKPEPEILYILSSLKKISHWEKCLMLQNHDTTFNPGKDMDFQVVEVLENNEEHVYKGDKITFDIVKKNGQWERKRVKFKARNNTSKTFHALLTRFSREFGIHILRNEEIPPGEKFVTLYGEDEEDSQIGLPDPKDENVDEAVVVFKLILSTEKVDDFLLIQEDLNLGATLSFRGLRADKKVKPKDFYDNATKEKLIINDDWFTKTITIKAIRQKSRISENDAVLKNNGIVIKRHDSFKANVCLVSSSPQPVDTHPLTIIPDVFGTEFEVLDFSSTSGKKADVLELTGIQGEENIKDNPLKIVLDRDLKEDELILPMTLYGNHFWLVGHSSADENGKAVITIDQIPPLHDERRRSPGKALKICFLKFPPGGVHVSPKPEPGNFNLDHQSLDYIDPDKRIKTMARAFKPDMAQYLVRHIKGTPDYFPDQIPVIFLAFANDRVDYAKYLRDLPNEHEGIRNALKDAEKDGLCKLVERANASVDTVFDVFQDPRYKDRIAIFHYGGHANGYKLLLESCKGGYTDAHKEGLVSFLSGQEELTFVFLNGCSTEQHALELKQAGIPAVVGTSQYIADDVAASLAVRFYKGIGCGHTIDRAWKEAFDEITTKKGKTGFNGYYHKYKGGDCYPWNIYYKEGAESVKNWNLPYAASDPLFGLPKIPTTYKLPQKPYLFLKSYERKHAKVFFGRSYYIRELYYMIDHRESPGIILLYGQSGVGKSSLLDAGLMPRLEKSHTVMYTRRIPEKGLLGTLSESLQNNLLKTKEESFVKRLKILEKWKEIEKETGKPLVMVLDQVEEMYTHPNEKLPQELENLSSALVEIFGDPENCPQGKLILGYRKEYHPEIKEEFNRKELLYYPVFIKCLNQKDIYEVITGITSTTALQLHYRLKIEDGLAEQIANHLSDDANSPVAPVLQIILTKMWDDTVPDHDDIRTFTWSLYDQLRTQGVLMGDFFNQQMKKLQESNKEEVESGLALDILKFHITDLGTAVAKSIDEIKTAYSNSKGKSKKIIEKMKSLFLLSDQYYSKNMTSLAHDTLAPIVIKEYNDSDKPGQRSARILAVRMIEYMNNKENTWLDEADLEIVEKGQKGMKALNDKEKKLLQESRKRKNRHRRLLKVAKAIQITYIAQSKVKKDPTIALRIAEKAYKLYKGGHVAQAIHKTYRENIFYKIVLRQETSISALALSPDGKYILTAFKDKDFTICLWDLEGKKVQEFKGHTKVVKSVAFSPNSKSILTGSSDKSACLWDLEGKKVQEFKGHTNVVNSVAFSPDGKSVLTGSSDGKARLWDREKGNEKRVFPCNLKVNTVAFSTNGKYILTGSKDGITRIWDLEKNEPPVPLKQNKEVNFAVFSPDDNYILTRSNNKSLILWNRDGSKSHDFKGHKRVTSVTFSLDSKYILTGAKDGTTRLWDLTGNKEGNKKQVFKVHKKGGLKRGITAVTFSPNNKFVLTGSQDGIIRLWDLQGKELQVFKGHTNLVTFVAFLNEGSLVLTGSEDKTIRKWDLQGNKFKPYEGRQDKGHQKAVNAVAVSHDGEILTGSNDKITILWDLSGKPKQYYIGHEKSVTSVAFSPDGKWVLTGSMDKTARLWKRETGAEIKVYNGHPSAVNTVAFSHDDMNILTGSSDKTAVLWYRKGKKIRSFAGHRCGVTSVAFSPDKRYVLTGSRDKTASLWSFEGKLKQDFKGHKDYVTAVAFSPCGKYILTGSRDETARLWNLKGKVLKVFEGHNEAVHSVAFSPDPKKNYKQYYILTGSSDNIAILWDGKGNRLQDFTGHKDSITSVAFSPDSKFILTGSNDKTARQWEIKIPLEDFLKSGDCETLSKEQIWEYGIEKRRLDMKFKGEKKGAKPF